MAYPRRIQDRQLRWTSLCLGYHTESPRLTLFVIWSPSAPTSHLTGTPTHTQWSMQDGHMWPAWPLKSPISLLPNFCVASYDMYLFTANGFPSWRQWSVNLYTNTKETAIYERNNNTHTHSPTRYTNCFNEWVLFSTHRSIIRSVLYKLYSQIWYVVIRDTSSRYEVVGRTFYF